MTEIRQWAGDFDLGQFLGIGLSTAQIGYLAGALFLALFGISALRRSTHAGGLFAALWIAVAIALFAGGLLVAARGFPDEVPEQLKPWTEPERLLRAAAVLALIGVSLVLMSAHWVQSPGRRIAASAVGLAVGGTGLWLAAGWFGDQLPDDAQPWAARAVVSRILIVAGVLYLAGTFWFGLADAAPHRRWAARTLVGPLAGIAVVFGLQWFGASIWDQVPVAEARQVTIVLAAVAAGTCGIIAVGAYLLRDWPARRPTRRRSLASLPLIPEPEPVRPLPVAVLLDADGRPVLPAPPQAGSAGV